MVKTDAIIIDNFETIINNCDEVEYWAEDDFVIYVDINGQIIEMDVIILQTEDKIEIWNSQECELVASYPIKESSVFIEWLILMGS